MKAGLAIESVAVKPETLTVARFHPEIIASKIFLFPPFHGDAFRSFDARDVELGAPPMKALGRIYRHTSRRYANFFGLFQQPERAKRRITLLAPARPCAVEIALLR